MRTKTIIVTIIYHCDKIFLLANGKFAVLYKPLICRAMLSSRCGTGNSLHHCGMSHPNHVRVCVHIEYDLKPDRCRTGSETQTSPNMSNLKNHNFIWLRFLHNVASTPFSSAQPSSLEGLSPALRGRAQHSLEWSRGRLNNMTMLLCSAKLIHKLGLRGSMGGNHVQNTYYRKLWLLSAPRY